MNEHLENHSWSSFLPHGQSFFWSPEILWTQILSDLIVAVSFFFIPVTVLYLFWFRRNDFSFRSIYILFAFFILAIGSSYVFNVIVLWIPLYQVQSAVKFITAVASISTAFFLWPLLPKALNISSEKLLEERSHELEFANDKYNLLLAGSKVGVYEWSDFDNPGKPIFWSARMFEILGFQSGVFEPTIDLYLSLIHPEDRPIIRDFFNLSKEAQIPTPVECRIRVMNEFRWFRNRHVVKSDEKGRAVFVIGSIEDIHEQKMADEKIRTLNGFLEGEIEKRTHQLEQASRAKTRFLANMSHEMRTPLGLVLGFSEILQENQNLDPETREYVHLITKNGEILSRVINDLLDLSKIEAGKLKFQYSKISAADLIGDFRDAFENRAKEKGLKFFFQNLCSESELIVTDEIRLKQIVYNLMANAIKFTDRGSIHLTLGKINQFYVIDISDTGIGIPESEKEQIFDEFSRGEMADSGPRAGTGLGLRLAQNLALALGGRIDLISSQIGKGSHFRFSFISDEQRLQSQVLHYQENFISNRLNDFEVFVVDDNEDNIRLAEVFLKKLGCQVRGFANPRSLFAEMASANPDLILLDINMPEMSGFEVFDRLRHSGYTKPIWALTAYSLNEDIQVILEHGFDDYIRKPISVESLRRKLTLELEGVKS